MSENQRITVSTTLPDLASLSELPRLQSERLFIRPFDLTDEDAFRSLRTDATVIDAFWWNPKETREQSREILTCWTSRLYSTFMFGIFLKRENREEGELIGQAGIDTLHGSETGWPNLQCVMRRDFQGNRYGKESILTILKAYSDVDRKDTQLSVSSYTVQGAEDGNTVREQVNAVMDADNVLSSGTSASLQAFLHKTGFGPMKDEIYGVYVDDIRRELGAVV